MEKEEKSICKNCGNKPYVHKCIWQIKDVMLECVEFKKAIGSAY